MDDNRDNGQSEVDQWLDAALQQRNSDPRMGLEERVLARLATEPRSKTFTWWPMLVGVAAALLLVSVALVLMQTGARDAGQMAKAPPQQPVSPSGAEPGVQATNLKPAAPPSVHRHLAARKTPDEGLRRFVPAVSRRDMEEERLPKLATFPAARPETREERLLAQLGKRPEFFEPVSTLVDTRLMELTIPDLRIDSLDTSESSPKQ